MDREEIISRIDEKATEIRMKNYAEMALAEMDAQIYGTGYILVKTEGAKRVSIGDIMKDYLEMDKKRNG